MTNPSQALDDLQAKVEAAVREYNATADPRKMHVAWGYRDKETVRGLRKYKGTRDEGREALLTFDGDDSEIYLCQGRDDRPGWLTICKYMTDVLPLPDDPQAIVDVLRGECAPTVTVDVLAGDDEDEEFVIAGAVSATVFAEGLTPRTLMTLLEDLSTSAALVLQRLEKEAGRRG
jgi:hypothetical protein